MHDVNSILSLLRDCELDRQSVQFLQEQLVVDKMILHPYKNCTLNLMEKLECERTTVYKLRASAVRKLYRLYFGAGEIDPARYNELKSTPNLPSCS